MIGQPTNEVELAERREPSGVGFSAGVSVQSEWFSRELAIPFCDPLDEWSEEFSIDFNFTK